MYCQHLRSFANLFAAILLLHPAHGVNAAKKDVNFIVILADDTGIGDVSVYNLECKNNITIPQKEAVKYGKSYSQCPPPGTPNIDRLATEGMLFTSWYAPHPVCTPSRAGLLTGRYPIRTGAFPGVFSPTSLGGLPSSEVTIAELLQKNGYATNMDGKWHLGHLQQHLPVNHGFESWTGIPWSHDFCPCPHNLTHTDDPQLCRPSEPGCPLYSNLEVFEQPAMLDTLTLRYAKSAIKFMEMASSQNKPFFQYLAFQHSHHPQFASEKFRGKSKRGAYGDTMLEMDHAVGLILDFIEHSDKNLKDNTLIFFTSDNGPSLIRYRYGGSAGNRRCGKGTTWEGGQNVAGVVWGPGVGVAQNSVNNYVANSLDIFPTIARFANVELPKDVVIDGIDLTATLNDGGKTDNNQAMFYYGLQSTGQQINAVRFGNYKLHFATSGWGGSSNDLCGNPTPTQHTTPLLFDLKNDTFEANPIDPTSLLYKTVRKELEELVLKHNCSNISYSCAGPNQLKAQNNNAQPFPPVPFHPWTPRYEPPPSNNTSGLNTIKSILKKDNVPRVPVVFADCYVSEDKTC